ISGPSSSTISTSTTASTGISALIEGSYKYQLTVTDNSGAIAKDTVQVTVNPAPNQSPSVTAGNNQTITLPTNTATLSGSGTDTDGTIASYKWIQTAGPGNSTI